MKMMARFAYWTWMLAMVIALSSCAHNIGSSDTNWRVYNKNYDHVWAAAVQAVPAI